jgi:hypothetical protein
MTNIGKVLLVVATALVSACSSSNGTLGSVAGAAGGGRISAGGRLSGGGSTGSAVGGDRSGTWVVTADGGSSKPGPGKNGNGGSSGTVVSATCTPGVVGAVVTGCGYPYASAVALTSVDFNESEVLRAIRPSIDVAGGTVTLLYNDEHAMTLGVRQVVVKSATGSTSTDYPVSPLATSPSSVLDPKTGSNALAGDNSGLDPSLRPLWPVLYVTDISSDTNSRSGDWQMGGRPINPNAVYGTWKSAVRTVDKTTSPFTVAVTPDADPAKNDWNLGINDPIPASIKDEGWSAEVKWNVTFQPGHSYRLQVIVHDGDQNKAGGDCGEACVVFCAGGSATPPPTTCADGTAACGEGLVEGSGYVSCAEGSSCVNNCCVPLACPTDAQPCGRIGSGGATVNCPANYACVSGCCLYSVVIQ